MLPVNSGCALGVRLGFAGRGAFQARDTTKTHPLGTSPLLILVINLCSAEVRVVCFKQDRYSSPLLGGRPPPRFLVRTKTCLPAPPLRAVHDKGQGVHDPVGECVLSVFWKFFCLPDYG